MDDEDSDRAAFMEGVWPIIWDWFCRLPISSEKFTLDPADGEELAAALWDAGLKPISQRRDESA